MGPQYLCYTTTSLNYLIFLGAANFKEAMRMGCEIYHTLKGVIKEKYGIDGKQNKQNLIKLVRGV